MTTTSKIAAATAGAVAGLLVAGCGPSQADEPRLAVFDQPATAQDTLPDGLEVEGYTEPRHIGDLDGALVYAARGTGQPWCIVIVIGGPAPDDAVAGGNCGPDHVFAQHGISVEVGGLGQHHTARLLPDDFTGHLEDGWEILGPNLAAPTQDKP